MAAGFYVYEHVRRDTGAVFYVGKGSGYRLRVVQHRSRHWHAIVRKHGYDARIVFETEDEELAFLAEQELIRRRRMCGAPLTNMTEGGEGAAGYKWSADAIEQRSAKLRGRKRPKVSEALRGRPKTVEHRAKLAAARRGTKAPQDSRARMSKAHKGRAPWNAGKTLALEHREAISRGITGERNPFYGRTHSTESRHLMSEAHRGFKHTDETRRGMSESRLGSSNSRFGVSIPEEQKARQIAALKAKPLLACPHCGRRANEGNARRWHFENCRSAA